MKEGMLFKAGRRGHVPYIWITRVNHDGTFQALGGHQPYIYGNGWIFNKEHASLFSGGEYKPYNWGWRLFYESL